MSGARIGFVVKTFPKLSETFILGEILGLERMGLQLAIFSMQRPTEHVHQQEVERVAAPVHYLDGRADAAPLAHIAARLAARFPARCLGGLALILRREGWAGWRLFTHALVLAEAARKAGITHLHAHFASEPASVAECAARLARIGYSISAHAKDIYTANPHTLRAKLRRARFVVTCTECNRQHLADLAGPSTPVYRMYHGIDVQRFSPGPRDAQDRPLILSVGRLREKKGFAALVQACAHLRDAGVAFRCEIVGYGEDRDRLQNLIDTLALAGQVELLGVMNHDQLVQRYRAASLFVLPCQIGRDGDRDGIPNVLLEALAMELPVVSTQVSGIPEIISHEETGLLVPPHDPPILAQAMQRLIGDAALRRRLGAQGRKKVQALFSNERNLELVQSLLAAATKTPATAHEAKDEKAYV